MSFSNIALGLGLGATALSYGSYTLNDARSSQNRDGWNWQYKGKLFEDRVGNFSFFSDNKSRYNDYLKNYEAAKVGYKFNLEGIDVQKVTEERTVQELYKGNTTYATNENLKLIGNPTGANTKDSNNLILENKVGNVSPFVTSYNNEKGRPNWVAQKLTKSDLGSVDRSDADAFRSDPNLKGLKEILPRTFKGFQMGHNVPSANATSSKELNLATFVMSNMTAQAGNMNMGPWAGLEHYLREQVRSNNKEVQILSGNFGKGGIGTDGYVERIGGVEVPQLMWKVAIILEPGQTEINESNVDKVKTVVSVMPNQQNIKKDWQNYRVADGNKLKKKLGYEQFFPGMDPALEEKILKQMYEPPSDKSKLLNLDSEISDNFKSAAMMRARSRGIHNPMMTPLYDADKTHQGLVISNKRTHSEQFEMARYNASMRASGRFTSVVEAEDVGTYEAILKASKADGNLSNIETRLAKAFDYAVNTPSLASRINEYFFIPNGMGRAYQEEKGFLPSLFGGIGALIDQAYITNNPVLKSYKTDGEAYFTTKNTFFQDLLSGSAATVLATASSIGVYLAVGEPLKAMASKALLNTEETLINNANQHNSAKGALGGSLNKNISFTLGVIERKVNGNNTAFYDINNPTFSLYYLDNYQRQRGAYFFSSTAKDFLINKINPYTIGGKEYNKLTNAINDYLEVLQSPADIKIIDRASDITIASQPIDWDTATINTTTKGEISVKSAINIVRGLDKTTPVTKEIAKEINDAIHDKYKLKITNVSIERNMELAKKIQGIINLVPMPWAWGIFNQRKDVVNSTMIGNLLDIEGFTRYVNASINNQGFWGAANEYMLFSQGDRKVTNPAFRIMNHMATFSRSILAFNERGGETKRELEGIAKISETYSNAEIKVTTELIDSGAVQRSAKGFDIFNTDLLDDKTVDKLLNAEANYQKEWKALAGKREGLQSITLDETLYKYANSNHKGKGLGFLLNSLDKGNSYTGMKIASSKLSAAKWILGVMFIPHLLGVEYAQRTGASLAISAWQQGALSATNTRTAIDLQSTNFFSAKEVATTLGANAQWTDMVGGAETLVSIAGLAQWAWQHGSTFNPEVSAKMWVGNSLFDSIEEVNGNKVSGFAEIQAEVGTSKSILTKLKTGEEIAFNIVRDDAKNIIGLRSLTAKIAKNWTSFGITLGLSLAAMQTARYVVTSAINNERNLMGSAVLSTYLLGVPAVIIGATTLIDNMVHTVNLLSGGRIPSYNDYKLTHNTYKLATKGIQGLANLFGKHPALATISAIGLVTAAYWNKWTPFQGDINGPKMDESNTAAINKLGAYINQVNMQIDKANSEGGSTNISESVSPLEVNGALLAVSLSKIINPILSSQKGSTAYVTASQSPLPIFQFYSVLKKVEDSNKNSYTTLGLGLQGPPALGMAPINVTFPIAFAMNAKSAENYNIRTGYFGTGFMLNAENKEGLSLQDYYNIYSQVAFWSAVAIPVSNTLVRNKLYGRSYQILKEGTKLISNDSLLTQSLRAGRDKFLGIATLPFSIAAQSLNLTVGDLRMPSLRLSKASWAPTLLSTFIGGALFNHIYTVFNQLSQPFNSKQKDKQPNEIARWGSIAAGGLLIGGISYYTGTIAASKRLANLESELLATNAVKFNKKGIDPLIKAMYSSGFMDQMHKTKLSLFGGLIKNKEAILSNKAVKALGLFAVGALWNHFITHPTVGKINPGIAFGDLTKQTEDKYSNSERRYTTVALGASLFAITAALTTFTPGTAILADINPEKIVNKYRERLRVINVLEDRITKNKNVTLLQKANLQYQKFRLGMEGKEVQIIIEEGIGNTPIIRATNELGEKLKNAVKVTDPYSSIKEKTTNRSIEVNNELQKLNITGTDDLHSVLTLKNNSAKDVIKALDHFGDKTNKTGQALKDNRNSTLRALGLNRSASIRVGINRWANLGTVSAAIQFGANMPNWISQGMGYKDFQDAFMGKDEENPNVFTKMKMGVVDLIKLQTNYDREYKYDIAKGLVGPNIHTSKGEFLISPNATVKGSINNSLNQLSNLVIISAPNTFIGVAVGGITTRPDDNDIRVGNYFQLQSASQDFSSAMYSMSSVFGLQQLASKGFLDKIIIANLRGVDEIGGTNQAQRRSFAAGIITAIYSQPTRSGKDRIKFTAPDKFTLEAMQGNKALSMSLSRRYNTLKSLSYGTNAQIANFMLLNNMNIAAPEMQSKTIKALMQLKLNDNVLGFGELNENFFMGKKITVLQSMSPLSNSNNPFVPMKLTIEDTNNENAFMDVQGLAVQATTNQYFVDKNFFTESAPQAISKFIEGSSLQGLIKALPPFLFLPLAFIGAGSLLYIGSALALNSITRASAGQLTKDNTALYEQQHKYYDEGKWFSKELEHKVIQGNNTKYLLIKRTQIVFNIAAGLDDLTIDKYKGQINDLSIALSDQFDSAYRDYSKNYGQLGEDYKKNSARLDDFYNKLEGGDGVSHATSTRAERIERAQAREFNPIMADRSVDIESIKYISDSQRITEHLLDEYTNKQVLDAYLEGQYDAYKEQNPTLKKQDFIDRYYKGFSYDEMLDAKTKGRLEYVKDKTIKVNEFNIFGKDRHANTKYSINHIKEVYAAKFDIIIDNYFDVLDTKINSVFKDSPDVNIYTEFSNKGLIGLEDMDETSIKSLSENRRFQLKQELRANIGKRLSSVMMTKRSGPIAAFDRLLTLVTGGTVRNNITRMNLEAGQAAMETMDEIRKYGGRMFEGPGSKVSNELYEEAEKAAKQEIKDATRGAIKGGMPEGDLPINLRNNTAGLTVLEGLTRFTSLLSNAFQATQFLSVNLLTLRASASIASSKTGQREKEMAREELAKEGFDNIFSGLFFGTILASEQSRKFGMTGAAGLAAGYFGYDMLFKHNKPLGAGFGIGAFISGIKLFKTSKEWGTSLALFGITLFGRSVIDMTGSSLSAISPEIGAKLTSSLDTFYQNGRQLVRRVQDNSGIINTIGGSTLAIGGLLNFNKNPVLGGLASIVGAAIALIGVGNIFSKDNRIEGASRATLGNLAQIAVTPLISKVGSNIVSRTIAAKTSEAIIESQLQKRVAGWLGNAALKKGFGAASVRGLVTAGRLAGAGLRLGGQALAGIQAGPWGLIATLTWTALEIAWILLSPESADEFASNVSHFPTKMIGEPGGLLFTPSNRIYNEKAYKDKDKNNPLFYGTVNDVMKQEWLAQVDILDDNTGRKAAGRMVTSYDAPMTGYSATAEGYGPLSVDPSQDLAFAIRGKAYTQLVTGKQFWNTRMTDKLNHEVVIQYMSRTEKLQIEAWELQINKTVETQNRKITAKPITSANQITASTKEAIEAISSVIPSFNKIKGQINEINTNKNLGLKVVGGPVNNLNNDKKIIFNSMAFTLGATEITKTINNEGQTVISFNKTAAPENEALAIANFNIIEQKQSFNKQLIKGLES